jgi:translation elongation factor EF-Tu-like GTPase
MLRIMVAITLGFAALTGGCGKERPPVTQSKFTFTVEEVFYIKSPVDRVILVGTIRDGAVHPGDKATVHCRSGSVSVTVEGIERFKQGDLPEAAKGQQVGLRLMGITKDQPGPGDRVEGLEHPG